MWCLVNLVVVLLADLSSVWSSLSETHTHTHTDRKWLSNFTWHHRIHYQFWGIKILTNHIVPYMLWKLEALAFQFCKPFYDSESERGMVYISVGVAQNKLTHLKMVQCTFNIVTIFKYNSRYPNFRIQLTLTLTLTQII